MSHVGFRYRLYPSEAQSAALARWAGCARALYNAGLEQRSLAHRLFGRSVKWVAQDAELLELKRTYPWLAEPHSDVLQQALRDLDRSFTAFFAGRARYPRFRRKGRADAFRIQARERGPIRVRRLNRRWGEVAVPKLGPVRFRWTRPPVGEITHLTVSHDALGWHVSLCCQAVDAAQPTHTAAPVGVDRGVANTVALSTGELRSCPDFPPGQVERLRRLERRAGRQETARRHRLNSKRRRSRRHQRTLDQVTRLKARQARIRKDFLHKLSTDLANNHSAVVIEDLRIANMTRSAKGSIEEPGVNVRQKAGLNRAILAQGWGELRRQLGYKTERAGGTLVEVPAAYTSQTCAECGAVDPASRRTQAKFACTSCGHAAHADVNAARNILAAGLGRDSAQSPPAIRRGNEARTTRGDSLPCAV